MNSWTGLFIFAGSVSLVGFVASFAIYFMGYEDRERKMVQREIQRSISDLTDQIWRLEVDAIDNDENHARQSREEIGQLDALKAGLIEAEKVLADSPEEEWERVKGETLRALDAARVYIHNQSPGPALRQA